MSQTWRQTKEVGSTWGLRFVILLCRLLGRKVTRGFLRLLVLYYASTNRAARRASREYRKRLKLPAGFWHAYRHLLCFAENLLDRVFLLRHRWDLFSIEPHGFEQLDRVRSGGKGAILVSAHFGSVEALRASGALKGLVVNIVADFDNARRITAILEELDATATVSLISATQSPAALVIQLRDAIGRGELVAMLADRSDPGGGALVDFLGSQVSFPTGPYALASVLRCPVYVIFGVYRAPNRYDLHCELFAEAQTIPRERRAQALAESAQRFADRLAEFCRLAPDNWFNFYDFWPSEPSEPQAPNLH